MRLNEEEKTRLYRVLSKTGIVLAVGAAYAAFVYLTGWGIPCVFRLATGLLCPGCGVSRMLMALLRLDFAAAARYNLLLLCLLPFGGALFFYKVWQYVKKGSMEMAAVEKGFYCVVFALCIVFCVLRNTGVIPFLAQS